MDKFTVYVPAPKKDCKYVITGPDCQILTINMKPGDSVEAEPGSMMFMSPSIQTVMRCGNCTRMCTGESLYKSIFTNEASQDGFLALTPNFPAKIIPVDLPTVGNKMVLKAGSYMSSIGEVSVQADYDCCSMAACCGGLGVIRQGVTGTGTVFLSAGGTVLTRELSAGETLVVDTDSIVGFQDSVKFDVRLAGGCSFLCFGGEGLFNSTMTGPGLVIVQSMSFDKYKKAVAPPQVNQPPDNNGEGPNNA